MEIDLDNWTWEQFYELCRAITVDLDGDGLPDRFGVEGYDCTTHFILTTSLFDVDNLKAGFNKERMEELLIFLKRLTPSTVGLSSGRVPLNRGGWALRHLTSLSLESTAPTHKVLRFNQFDWDVLPFPHGPQGESKSKLFTVQMGMVVVLATKMLPINFSNLSRVTSSSNTKYGTSQYATGQPESF